MKQEESGVKCGRGGGGSVCESLGLNPTELEGLHSHWCKRKEE